MSVTTKTFIDKSDIPGVIAAMSSVANAITAYAGGGQANATALTASFNRVTTVASVGDSVKLPAATLGAQVTVFNKGSNSMDVFPATGDKVNALSTNAGYGLATAHGAIFTCMVTGTWDVILSV